MIHGWNRFEVKECVLRFHGLEKCDKVGKRRGPKNPVTCQWTMTRHVRPTPPIVSKPSSGIIWGRLATKTLQTYQIVYVRYNFSYRYRYKFMYVPLPLQWLANHPLWSFEEGGPGCWSGLSRPSPVFVQPSFKLKQKDDKAEKISKITILITCTYVSSTSF